MGYAGFKFLYCSNTNWNIDILNGYNHHASFRNFSSFISFNCPQWNIHYLLILSVEFVISINDDIFSSDNSMFDDALMYRKWFWLVAYS